MQDCRIQYLSNETNNCANWVKLYKTVFHTLRERGFLVLITPKINPAGLFVKPVINAMYPRMHDEANPVHINENVIYSIEQ